VTSLRFAYRRSRCRARLRPQRLINCSPSESNFTCTKLDREMLRQSVLNNRRRYWRYDVPWWLSYREEYKTRSQLEERSLQLRDHDRSSIGHNTLYTLERPIKENGTTSVQSSVEQNVTLPRPRASFSFLNKVSLSVSMAPHTTENRRIIVPFIQFNAHDKRPHQFFFPRH
jgi:hypothetical protein